MLTRLEYDGILKREFSDGKQQKIVQRNYYFDTKDHQLKDHLSALRIRTTQSLNELTLKVPSQGFLLETNIPLSDNKCSEILDAKKLNLSDVSADIDIETLNKQTVFYLFNHFETQRFEKRMGTHLLVLDQTTFQNGRVDYELELESTDAKEGKAFFEAYLKNSAIPYRPAQPKIARAGG